MAEFDPGQLDQLEDALELIDDLDDLGSLELSPALDERLGEYQDVLAMCREAFPIEEPADALLSNVIAEAHEVSRRHRRDPEASAWQRFWERWRGTLIPGFALAGTAAAVLWIIGPEQAAGPVDNTNLLEAPRDEDSGTPLPSEPAGQNQEPAPDTATTDDSVETDAQLGGGETPSADDAGSGTPTPAKADERKRPPQKQSKVSPPPTLDEAPEPEPLSKEDTWTELERANAARARGECDAARSHYETVVAAATDNSAVARARAGIGLCFEQQQRYGEADKWFAKARATSPGIDAWINAQRDEQPMPGESKHKKRKAKQAIDKQQSEAFEDSL